MPGRSLDVDVVLDLMIHDIEIAQSLVGRPVTKVEAVGVRVLTPFVDLANARLTFEGGCVANLTASRISRERVRKLRVFQPEAYLSVDYAEQSVECYRVRGGGCGQADRQGPRRGGEAGAPPLRARPLRGRAAREGRAARRRGGRAGRRRTAQAILTCMEN